MVMTSSRLTAEEYHALPHTDRWTQLIDGEVVVDQPNLRHQRIAGELHGLLWSWLREHPGQGEATLPVDVQLGDRNVFAPDVVFVVEPERPARDARRIVGPPSLAIEVRSPSSWRYDVGAKKSTYEQHGLAELWLVDTRADTVLVYRRSTPEAPAFDVALEIAAEEPLSTPLIPGLVIDLAALFDR